MKKSIARLCVVPRVSGVGGMVSFREKFTKGLSARGVEVCDDLNAPSYDAVLVIGGTRHLVGLWRAKQRGVPIVQRLDGMNWLHRQLRTGLRHYLRAEYGNRLLAFIRNRLADRVIYQSRFARQWWERAAGPTPVPSHVVHNGVDLAVYTPHGPHQRPGERYRLLLVEGTLSGGYEMGLETAVQLTQALNHNHRLPVELMIVGRVAPSLRQTWERRAGAPLIWSGLVPPERIPEIDRSAHLLYAADLNAACPNATIEALACGTPVVAFDTGALPELVTGDSGRIVPYGGNPWQLDPPNVPALAEAAAEILHNQERFRTAARARAEAAFGLEAMVEGYLNALM